MREGRAERAGGGRDPDDQDRPDDGGGHGVGVILDTNVFVAAGFNPRSASAGILERVRSGELRLIWNDPVRRETQAVLGRIPRLSWGVVAGLFREDGRYAAETDPEKFEFIQDPDDRKFAALAAASGAVLVTNDEHLLSVRGRAGLKILTPREFAGGRE